MSGGIVWRSCDDCDGSGQVVSILEERPVTCYGCGGHGKRPDDSGRLDNGAVWFWRPGDWRRQRIACLHGDLESPGKWRVTLFDQAGPMSHHAAPAGEIMRELDGYHETARAAWLLDDWARRPRWQEGIERATITAYWNTLYYHAGYEIARQVDDDRIAHGTASALQTAERLRKAHCPKVAIFG